MVAEPQHLYAGTADNKRALLEAMAKSGSAGKAAFDAAQAELATTRQNALGRMLAGPQAQDSAVAAQVSAPVEATSDRFAMALANQRASFEQDQARRQGANESYLGQVDAAQPVIKGRIDENYKKAQAELEAEVGRRRSDLEHQLAVSKQRYEAEQEAARQKAAQDAADRAEDMAWRREQQGHQRAQWAAEALKASSGADMSDSDLETYLIGAARRADEQGLVGNRFPDMPGGVLQGGKRALSDVAREIGTTAGYDPNRVYGRIDSSDDAPPAPVPQAPVDVKNIMSWAKTDEKTARSIATNKDYTTGREDAWNVLNSPVDGAGLIDVPGPSGGVQKMSPWDAYLAYIAPLIDGSGPMKDRTYRALLSEFEPLFRSSGRR